jgi:hypothetical protein
MLSIYVLMNYIFSSSSILFFDNISIYLDNLSSTLTTPTKEHGENSPVGSGESIKSSDSITTGQTINGSLSKLSPDISSDGAGTNDADSIVSFESQKSNTAAGRFSDIVPDLLFLIFFKVCQYLKMVYLIPNV